MDLEMHLPRFMKCYRKLNNIMEKQNQEIIMLRYKESTELVASIKDPITQNFMSAVSLCIIKRFLTKENLPIENFDLGFFSEAMLEFCSDHKFIQSILNGEKVGWFEADEF